MKDQLTQDSCLGYDAFVIKFIDSAQVNEANYLSIPPPYI